MRYIYLSLFFILLLEYSEGKVQFFIGETEVDTQSIVTGLDTPWEILWGPGDHIWFTERYGRVSRVDPSTGLVDELLVIDEVHEQSESGLLGMALHPDFTTQPYVYLVYNYLSQGSIKEKLVRYSYNGSILSSPETLMEDIGGAGNHNGSRLLFGEDGKLYMTTGDAVDVSTSQNLGSLNGKILRMNDDGSIPDDNPFEDSYIWTFGHRNPQGLILGPEGIILSSEHGPSNDDEINIIEKGRNYGWPNVHGFCDGASEMDFCNENNVKEPIAAWTPTLAVAGIDFYASDLIPEWENSILITTLKEAELYVLTMDESETGVIAESRYFNNWWGRLRDICIAPDGRVFISSSERDGRGSPVSGDDRIVEIRPVDFQVAVAETAEPELKVFPNPVEGSEILITGIPEGARMVRILDASGRLVYETSVLNEGSEIRIKPELSSGFYLIRVEGTDKVRSIRFLKL